MKIWEEEWLRQIQEGDGDSPRERLETGISLTARGVTPTTLLGIQGPDEANVTKI